MCWKISSSVFEKRLQNKIKTKLYFNFHKSKKIQIFNNLEVLLLPQLFLLFKMHLYTLL